MGPAWQALLLALREPARMAGFDAPTWDLLLRQALPTGLIGRLGLAAREQGFLRELPQPVWQAMESMLSYVERQQHAVRWELFHLQRLFADFPAPVLLLKGAAYVAADLPAARGRLFSDMDILVPHDQLPDVESRLRIGTWFSAAESAYDERYYRRWMHELPPFVQAHRGTALDVHHRLLPLTARTQTPPEPLFATARPLPGLAPFAVPQPIDLVLHSACHLFHEGEGGHLLRDLSDIDTLLRAQLQTEGEALWHRLSERAQVLNLVRPLHHALRYGHALLHLPVPAEVLQAGAPPAWQRPLLDAMFLRAFSCAHRPSRLPGTGLAATALYLRGHALRMPARLLVPHLLTKAWMGWRERLKDEAPAQEGADAAADLERQA